MSTYESIMSGDLSLRDAAVELNKLNLRQWQIDQIAQVLRTAAKLKSQFKDPEAMIKKVEEATEVDWRIFDTMYPRENCSGALACTSGF